MTPKFLTVSEKGTDVLPISKESGIERAVDILLEEIIMTSVLSSLSLRCFPYMALHSRDAVTVFCGRSRAYCSSMAGHTRLSTALVAAIDPVCLIGVQACRCSLLNAVGPFCHVLSGRVMSAIVYSHQI